MDSEGVAGVLCFMIGLLLIQIVVVWVWGIEPALRGLETLFERPSEQASAERVRA